MNVDEILAARLEQLVSLLRMSPAEWWAFGGPPLGEPSA